MAEYQNFRSAFNGFNREDVVHYIEYINNLHAGELNKLRTELREAQEELAALRSAPAPEPVTVPDEETVHQLEEALAKCSALEAELQEARVLALQAAAKPQTDDELEAYRRAERAERLANERVHELYRQANGALGDATAKVDDAATQIGELADQVIAQLGALQTAVISGKASLRDAAAGMYAVRPIPTEE